MEKELLVKVFYADRESGVLLFVGGVLFVACGILVFNAVGLHLFSIAYSALGLLSFLVAWSWYKQSITISEHGIIKKPMGYSIPWERIDYWYQGDRHTDTIEDTRVRKVVNIQLVGQKRFTQISDIEVSRPGYFEFVREIQQYAKSKEQRRPNQAL